MQGAGGAVHLETWRRRRDGRRLVQRQWRDLERLVLQRRRRRWRRVVVLVLARQVTDPGQFEQRTEHERHARQHPHVDGLQMDMAR